MGIYRSPGLYAGVTEGELAMGGVQVQTTGSCPGKNLPTLVTQPPWVMQPHPQQQGVRRQPQLAPLLYTSPRPNPAPNTR